MNHLDVSQKKTLFYMLFFLTKIGEIESWLSEVSKIVK